MQEGRWIKPAIPFTANGQPMATPLQVSLLDRDQILFDDILIALALGGFHSQQPIRRQAKSRAKQRAPEHTSHQKDLAVRQLQGAKAIRSMVLHP